MNDTERVDRLRSIGFGKAVQSFARGEPPHSAYEELFECTYTDPWKFYTQPIDGLVPILESGTTVIAANKEKSIVEFSLEEPSKIRFEINENKLLILLLVRAAIERYEAEENISEIQRDMRDATMELDLVDCETLLERLSSTQTEEQFYECLFEMEGKIKHEI